MDTFDLFRKLSSGIKFDKKRFGNDARRFQLTKHQKNVKENAETKTKAIQQDFSDGLWKRKREESVFEDDHNNIDDEDNRNFEDKSSHKKDDKNNLGNESSTVLALLDGIIAAEDGSIIRPKKKLKMTEDIIFRQKRQKVNEIRNDHCIHVTGTRVPPPIETFQQMCAVHNVKSCIVQNIISCKYITPTAIQMQTIPIMLQQRNLLACAPTGSGKTIAFLLPVINQLKEHRKTGFRAIILAPTRELAQQIYRECLKLSEGCKLELFNNTSKEALEKLRQKNSKKFDLLISTPSRLVSLIRQEFNHVLLSRIEWLIIDEADKLFEEGNRAFKSQFEEIFEACQNEKLRCAMFSATNPVDVTYWCRHNLRQLITVTIGQKNAAADTIEQKLTFVGNEHGKLTQLRNLFQKGVSPPLLIFVQSKERAQELFRELIYDNVNVDVIHSDRTQMQRDNVVRCFREGKIWVLICTELMSRGIDFQSVNLVINYDFPRSAISYIHRIGRTGRAGRKGKAITFFTQQDIEYLRSIAKVMRESGCTVPDYMFAMKQFSKKKRRKIENIAPQRQTICTIPGFQRQSKLKQNKE